jgi:N-hydroxyarylamine O-acetyltransferase
MSVAFSSFGSQGPQVNVEAYCRRIGYRGGLTPSPEVLRELHIAHVGAIPFENLDVLLGVPVRLDLSSLQSKLVDSRRGGYCFEQNTLFKAVLESIGFKVDGVAARVVMGETTPRPRLHMALIVHAAGELYLADVGFGGDGLLEPLPFEEGEFKFPLVSYKLSETLGEWRLSGSLGRGWEQLYVFTLEPQHAVDYDVANYYTSTHPDSVFRKTLTAQRVTPTERLILRRRELTVIREEGVFKQEIGSAEEIRQLLRERFDIHLRDDRMITEELFGRL